MSLFDGDAVHYFITIYTKERRHDLGKVAKRKFAPSEIGKIAEKNWRNLPEKFPSVSLDEFVIMPDYLHGIVVFANPLPITFLSEVMLYYKLSVAREANQNSPSVFSWQPSFFDRLIADQVALDGFRSYIKEKASFV